MIFINKYSKNISLGKELDIHNLDITKEICHIQFYVCKKSKWQCMKGSQNISHQSQLGVMLQMSSL